jgi:hypothetical protein
MHETKSPDPTANQIPWAKRTEVVAHVLDWRKDYGVNRIELQTKDPWRLAKIYSSGSVDLEVDSEEIIGDYMKKSPRLTRSLREFLDISGARYFHDYVEDWLTGTTPEPSYPTEEPGVLDWEPTKKPREWKRLGKLAYHRKGKSTDLSDDWIGSTFPYAHAIFFDETKWPQDGLVVNFGDKPEVWLGDVDGFLVANEESFESPESYLDYNARFENGWIWALNELGVFQNGNVPDWAIDIITVDPDVMWPEIVEQLVPQLDSLDPELRTGVLRWLENRQVERDQAAGQLRIWPRREDA